MKPIRPWRFEFDRQIAQSELPVGKQAHCINDLTRKIYIFDDMTLYLSDKGLVEVERFRQLVHEMVQLFTDLKDPPPGITSKNRGAVVQLTDKIIEQAKLKFNKRLVYELATVDDLSKQAVLLSHPLEASRAAALEDQQIKNMNLEQSLLNCVSGCRKKRSLQKATDAPAVMTRATKLFNQDVDLKATKQKIRNFLKKYRITQGISEITSAYPLFDKKNSFFAKHTSPLSIDASVVNRRWITTNYSRIN